MTPTDRLHLVRTMPEARRLMSEIVSGKHFKGKENGLNKELAEFIIAETEKLREKRQK